MCTSDCLLNISTQMPGRYLQLNLCPELNFLSTHQSCSAGLLHPRKCLLHLASCWGYIEIILYYLYSVSRLFSNSFCFTFKYIQNLITSHLLHCCYPGLKATISHCKYCCSLLSGLLASIPALCHLPHPHGMCSTEQPEWSFWDVSQTTLLLKPLKFWVKTKILTCDLARYSLDLTNSYFFCPSFRSSHMLSVFFRCAMLLPPGYFEPLCRNFSPM